MNVLYALFIALTNNLDNIGVIFAYSIKGIKISISINLWISIITFIISTLAAYLGLNLSFILDKHISSVISMLLLLGIGLWIIFGERIMKSIKKRKRTDSKVKDSKIKSIIENPVSADADNSKDIDFKEATFLAIALSINNIGGGFSAGMLGLNIYFIGFLSALISFLALLAGDFVYRFFRKFNLGEKANVISGILLILIGIKQIL